MNYYQSSNIKICFLSISFFFFKKKLYMQYILDFDIELNVWLLKKGIYHQNGFGVFPTKNAIDAMLEIRNLLFIFLIIYNLELKFGSNKNRQENKNKLKNDENFPHFYLYNFEFQYKSGNIKMPFPVFLHMYHPDNREMQDFKKIL